MGLYMLYILSALGFVGLILSLAIALIVAAFVSSFEIVTASVVVSGVAYVLLSRWLGIRSSCKAAEGFSDGTPHEITTLMDTMTKKKYGPDRVVTPDPWSNTWSCEGPTGVLSGAVEGFANASTDNADKNPKKGAPATSTSASANISTNTNLDKKANAVNESSKAASDAAKIMSTEKFTDGGAPGLFKLGELPSESKDGPHLDVGSTLMKAMSSLKPDQITSMTTDTQELLKTQQNLMGMLQSMQPILKDGRKLLDTFSGIFGGDSGGSKAFNLGG